MPTGLQTYSESGILQFDSDFPQYHLTQLFKLDDNYRYSAATIKYTASDRHIMCTWQPEIGNNSVTSYKYRWLFTSARKLGPNSYEVSVNSAAYEMPYHSKHRLLIFEPSSLTPPSNHLVGLETYDAQGNVIYSSGRDALKIVSTFVVPPSNFSTGNFYGNSAPSKYWWFYDTNIPTTDPSNYAVILGQIRDGLETDYPGDPELDFYSEGYTLYIKNGKLCVRLNAFEVGSAEQFWAYWQTGGFNTLGTQIGYVVDVSNYKNRLLAPIP